MLYVFYFKFICAHKSCIEKQLIVLKILPIYYSHDTILIYIIKFYFQHYIEWCAYNHNIHCQMINYDYNNSITTLVLFLSIYTHMHNQDTHTQ